MKSTKFLNTVFFVEPIKFCSEGQADLEGKKLIEKKKHLIPYGS